MKSGSTVLLLAGEPSGDAYAGALARELGARRTELRFVGTGGRRMRDAGVELLAGIDDLAVMGFAEVLSRLGFFRALQRRVERVLESGAVGLAVLVDFPGFNLRAAKAAKRHGVPVLYYVAPKVWAWRPQRARALARDTDRVAVVLPFEADFLGRLGVRATYVGHPLLDSEPDDTTREDFCARWGLDASRPLLAVLPGSRRQELQRHLAVFVEAACRVRALRPDVQPVVGRAPALTGELLRGIPFPIVDDVPALIRHADAALAKSGTVTLETALARTPTVVAYRTSATTWALARRLLRVQDVSLPNLILGERVVPELLQEMATPEALAAALLPLLEEAGPERRAQVEALARVRAALGERGATGRVADMAIELLGASP